MSDEKSNKATAAEPSASNFNRQIFFLGLYHLVMVLLFAYMLIIIWPEYDASGKNLLKSPINLFGCCIPVGTEVRLLLLVIVAAALGSYVHASTSFVSYVGNKSLAMSWAWWYILRPFIGMSLALIFYFVIRGGLLSTGTNADEISFYGIAAVAGLVGMFSKQATDKLEELFNTLFKTKEGGGDDARKDKLGEKISVNEKMIPINKITFYTISGDNDKKDIKLEEIYKMFNETVTRVPVLDNDNILQYVIHQSIIYKFISEKSINASLDGKPFDVKALTLDDFLKHKGIEELVHDAIAFVPKEATLLKAKEEMENVKNCQDVFITDTGKEKGKVLGWLTNIDIGKYLTA